MKHSIFSVCFESTCFKCWLLFVEFSMIFCWVYVEISYYSACAYGGFSSAIEVSSTRRRGHTSRVEYPALVGSSLEIIRPCGLAASSSRVWRSVTEEEQTRHYLSEVAMLQKISKSCKFYFVFTCSDS